VARGLASLAVVLFHFIHFYWLHGRPAVVDHSVAPLYSLLKPIYEHGGIAVNLFFCLSGFVFFWLYEREIREQRMSPIKFGWLRFSRLYPLHLATLFMVLVLQATFTATNGQPFVYTQNDAYHLGLNLFFLQASTLERGLSFNGPTWSISVECLLYALFFVAARWGLLRTWITPVLFALVGLIAWQFGYTNIGHGIAGFFVGGVTYHAFVAIKASRSARFFSIGITFGASAAWAAVLTCVYAGFTLSSSEVADIAMIALLLPATVLALALVEVILKVDFSQLAWLGDISYASYLLHFPLELLLALVLTRGLIPRDSVTSVPGLVVFFAALIVASRVVYRRFEMPAQRWLRRVGDSEPEGSAQEKTAALRRP
jgi:peptidoglycan/LPS O-acetylase OafA/YrhL